MIDCVVLLNTAFHASIECKIKFYSFAPNDDCFRSAGGSSNGPSPAEFKKNQNKHFADTNQISGIIRIPSKQRRTKNLSRRSHYVRTCPNKTRHTDIHTKQTFHSRSPKGNHIKKRSHFESRRSNK